jgi:DNA replication and repair protein RecF
MAALDLGDGDAPVTLGTGTRAEAPERRVLRVNGAGAALASLSEWLSVVWLTPAMDRLFSDTAGARRRFLDRLVLALDGAHGGRVTRYEAAMRERSRLLAADAPADPAWLTALEAGMAEHGSALARARRVTVRALAEAGAPADGFPKARLALAGEAWEEPEALAAALMRSRGQDAAAGRALVGPHRADLAVMHDAKAMAAGLCSTGEQKALLVGIVLAHAGLVAARRGRAPLLLLDEVAAHLDAERRAALFGRLSALGAQTWVTGTDAGLFEAVEGDRFVVADGTVTAG